MEQIDELTVSFINILEVFSFKNDFCDEHVLWQSANSPADNDPWHGSLPLKISDWFPHVSLGNLKKIQQIGD